MPIKAILGGVAALMLAIFAWSSFIVVPEGHVAIQTRFGEAVSSASPGLHFKAPFIDGSVLIEVRERKLLEEMGAATNNQLPIATTVSVNWTVKADAALDLYRRYGTLSQFEATIIAPKLRQAAKASIAKFNADELVRNREQAVAKIQDELTGLMSSYPVVINSPQLENFSLPEQYLAAVMAKEKAREDSVREEYTLKQQALSSQQTVQTAEANREAEKARADGAAYATRVQAEAEAEAVRLQGAAEAERVTVVQSALAQSPAIIAYEQVKKWQGGVPQTVMSGDGQLPVLLQMQAPGAGAR